MTEWPLWDDLDIGDEEQCTVPGVVEFTVVRNVTRPTLTPVLPVDASGTAVIVAPGGAHHFLSMESEGFAVAERLREEGHAAYVLKYRLLPTPADPAGLTQAVIAAFTDRALVQQLFATHAPTVAADGRRAIELVRPHADRVVLLGFSAGGHLVVETLRAGGTPDAAAVVYLPSIRGGAIPPGPPLFLAAAADDPLGIDGTVELLDCWRSAGRPVEAHVYERGGHGFGMNRQGLASDGWIDRFAEWLTSRPGDP